MVMADIDVVILAGGLGTRLRGVLPETPKILAPVLGRPFLDHVLEWLARQGVRRVVLGLGYRAGDVLAYLEQHPFPALEIRTVVEPEPLGTAGALAYARPQLRSNPVLAMNGDTIVTADLNRFLDAHLDAGTPASILCAEVEDAGRYGRLEIDGADRVVRFREKDLSAAGRAWINAGLYLFGAAAMEQIGRLRKGSLERDILEKMPAGMIYAFRAAGGFLDIGTPESLAMAAEVLTA